MKKILSVLVAGIASALFLFASPAFAFSLPVTISPNATSSVHAFVASHTPHKESAQNPNIDRTTQIVSPTNASATIVPLSTVIPSALVQIQAPAAATSSATSTTTYGPNLIVNPSFETASGTLPTNWLKGGYGTNNRVLSYPASPAHSGSKAASITISSYTSGDAKWYFPNIPVSASTTYQFSDWYSASTTTEVDVQVTHTNGTITYIVLGHPAAASTYTQFSATFTAPADAASVTVFHVINKIGTLTVDDYALQTITVQQVVVPPPPPSNNFVQNGDFETAGTNGLPAAWIKGGYGSSTRALVYPAPGQTGSGASITVSNYVSGDAKWASNIINQPSGTYVYSDSYEASVPTILTAEFDRADGSAYYTDLKTLPASGAWTTDASTFTVPSDVVGFRVFHLINQNGTLTIDNVSVVTATSTGKGVFSTGAVSFRFDDGIEDQYQNAAPILDAAGFKGTFYIISQQILDNQFSGYMSIAQIQNLYSRGDEIGAHTRTHPYLTTLSAQQQEDEIAGSRQDILGWNVGPVLSFAYPYGDYDATTTQIVEDAGFQSAAATIDGDVTPDSDHYQLQYQEVNNNTPLSQVEEWVDTAAQTHTWVILTFHDVYEATSTNIYSTTPEEFQGIVNYVQQKGIPVVTVSQGMQSF